MGLSHISGSGYWAKTLRLPLRLIPMGLTIPVLRGSLRGKKWIVGSGVHAYWVGSYEYDKQKALEVTIREGSVFFDVGAHVGFYTLLACVLAGPHGKVFAFEPLPRNVSYIREHLRLNRLTNATVIEAAVSDDSGTELFTLGQSNSEGRLGVDGGIKVRTVALDDLVSRGEVPAPDYIKIDVEGAEVRVLAGARRILVDKRPTLFLATHSKSLHKRSCAFLQRLGYAPVPLIPGKSIDSVDEILAVWKV